MEGLAEDRMELKGDAEAVPVAAVLGFGLREVVIELCGLGPIFGQKRCVGFLRCRGT